MQIESRTLSVDIIVPLFNAIYDWRVTTLRRELCQKVLPVPEKCEVLPWCCVIELTVSVLSWS